jgi:hypothetical protein
MNERRDRIRVHIEGKEYNVVGGGFQEMLAAVKQITGRRFNGETKVWQLPGTAEEITNQLSISNFELEAGAAVAPAPTKSQTAPAAPTGPGGDRIRIVVGEHRLAVIGGQFREMLETVKGLPGRRFNGEAKVWEISGEVGAIKGMIEAAGFQLEGAEKIAITAPGKMEPPRFAQGQPGPPPPFEEPDFFGDDEVSPMEPPDWWDDDEMPAPLPVDEWDAAGDFPPFDEPPPFDNAPPAGQRAAPSGERAEGDRIRVRLGETALVITGGAFQEMLAAIKNIPGRRFNSQDKVWELPDDLTLDSVDQAMRAAGFAVLPE